VIYCINDQYGVIAMKMFRAVPKDGFDDTKIYQAQSTRRMPSNIPYLVDNIWEWLRPEDFPSRRFAAYSSPTPELALANASAVGSNPDLYTVCEVVFNNPDIKIAHIPLKDAREHKEISAIMRRVAASLGKDFSNMSIAEKVQHAGLYMPSVSKEELDLYFNSSPSAQKLAEELKEISTFWKEASLIPRGHNGELFFEVSGDMSYILKKLE
jgi:hypothetical protein